MKRRKFVKDSTMSLSLIGGSVGASNAIGIKEIEKVNSDISDINIVGPKEGYTPQIGTLVSMLNWMRDVILTPVYGMSIAELDFILDDQSNSIGAMLWHLAATERFYQGNTFNGEMWSGLSTKDTAKWNYASNLGSGARRNIKGYDLDFYLELLENVRSYTLSEFKKRDDEWLMIKDNNFWNSPTNNYCKWFHVCEHESNHNGQIKYIKKRII